MKSKLPGIKNVIISIYRYFFSCTGTKKKVSLFFIFLLFLPSLLYTQIITTIAGTGVAGYNGDGISAATALLFYPHNVAVDAAGNIYFPDYNNSRIRKITISSGLISTVAGNGTAGFSGDGMAATLAQINQPTSLAFDGNGDLYFTDRTNQRVRKVTMTTGVINTVAGTGTGGYNGDGIAATAAQLNGPNAVAFDAAGNMFISDWFNQRVRKVDKLTGLISTICGTGVAGFNGDGIIATTSQIDGPCGIAFDNSGNIYIAAYSGHRIRKISISTGLIITVAGTGTAGFNSDGIAATTALLNWPAYISFDAAGNLYIGDDNNFRIRKIDAGTGLISTVAGIGTQGYNGDGIAATTAQLNHAYCPYFDKNNCSLLIADTYNQRVRKVTGGFSGCLPAVAIANQISCQILPAVTIDNSNNNQWVPVYDSAGRIAAEINANGNNLGIVSTSLFTKTGACREDVHNRLYLNRNISITPQNQPSSNVSVRLYVLKAELDSLKNALNSMGQPSGVASINEVDIFKNNDACLAVGVNTALPLTATNASYNTNDYYLQVSVSSFSSFYFANKLLTYILPVKIRSFAGRKNGEMNVLNWEADCNVPLQFIIQRSNDGNQFQDIGNISSPVCNGTFYFTDRQPPVSQNYYRLKIIEAGGKTSYSAIILLPGVNGTNIYLHLTPAFVNTSLLNMLVGSASSGPVEFIITDMTGRMIMRRLNNVQSGSSFISVGASALTPGIYYMYAVNKDGRSNTIRFIKQ